MLPVFARFRVLRVMQDFEYQPSYYYSSMMTAIVTEATCHSKIRTPPKTELLLENLYGDLLFEKEIQIFTLYPN